MNKFTPGPWWVGPANEGVGIGIHTTAWTIADMCRDVPELDRNAEANARLMSAAPRMYTVIEARAAAGDIECMAIIKAIGEA